MYERSPSNLLSVTSLCGWYGGHWRNKVVHDSMWFRIKDTSSSPFSFSLFFGSLTQFKEKGWYVVEYPRGCFCFLFDWGSWWLDILVFEGRFGWMFIIFFLSNFDTIFISQFSIHPQQIITSKHTYLLHFTQHNYYKLFVIFQWPIDHF